MITVSKREDYGIMLVTELVDNFDKRLIPLSQVAKKHKIPLFFLRNIAHDLRLAKIIDAVEGKNGGYKLAKDPKEIMFGQVLEILSKKPLFSCCQKTSDGKCHKSLCPHGFSPRRLANEFLEGVYKKTFKEVVLYAYNKKSNS